MLEGGISDLAALRHAAFIAPESPSGQHTTTGTSFSSIRSELPEQAAREGNGNPTRHRTAQWSVQEGWRSIALRVGVKHHRMLMNTSIYAGVSFKIIYPLACFHLASTYTRSVFHVFDEIDLSR